MKAILIGLDCLGPEVLRPPLSEAMPNVNAVARRGMSGVLESILPPITVPAWTCMLSGRDPGELGLYGFRNRTGFQYDALRYSNSRHVRVPRIWDLLARSGRPSIVVGVPQTSPPPKEFLGALVCGFEGPLEVGGPYTSPASLGAEIDLLVGAYIFDVHNFRCAAPAAVRDTVYQMTERRFAAMRRLLATHSWDFAMIHEIGPDRMHHLFWRDHDPTHPEHDPSSPFRSFIIDYYRVLDRMVGDLVDAVGLDTAIIIASDHGATAMHGAIAVNEILIRDGFLHLREDPSGPTPLTPEMIDWSRTRAWAEGGYYARIFLNITGREPNGLIAVADRASIISELRRSLATVDLGDGRVLHNVVYEPREIYKRVRGIAPDLMVFFENESWRSIGQVGVGKTWQKQNNTGADNANHSRAGMYALAVPHLPAIGVRNASILDIAPTIEALVGVDGESGRCGCNLLRN